MVKKASTDPISSRARIDEQTGDVHRRERGAVVLDELYYRRRGRLVLRDVSDELAPTKRHPRSQRLRPSKEPDEIPVGKEDRVVVLLLHPSPKSDEVVEVNITSLPDLHNISLSGVAPVAGSGRSTDLAWDLVEAIETARLTIRTVVESDRARFVELFTDEAFTVFSEGVHDIGSANLRFDRMLSLVDLVPYAKQPVIVRATGMIVGYTGVGTCVIDGMDRLEWGWRLAPDARGRGYATEATTALLARADAHEDGELLCIIAVDNVASRRLADKVGFRWRQRIDWLGDPSDPVDLLVRTVGAGGPPLLAPDPTRPRPFVS